MKYKVLYVVFVIMFVLISCNENSDIVDNDEKELLTFRITWKEYSGRGEAIQKIISEYNNRQEDYEIDVVSGNEDLDEIRTLLDDSSIDVFVLPYRYVQLLGSEDKLNVLSHIEYDKDAFPESILSLGQVNDVSYGLPWMSHSMALIYNKNILEEAGVDPLHITDRDSFEEALKQIESVSQVKGIGLVGADHNDLSWMVNQFIYGNGSKLVEDGKVAINNENSYEAIEYYRDILSKYAQDTWQTDTGTEVMKYFRNQEVAFEIQGLWGVTDIWKNGSPFEVGILPLEVIEAYSEVGPMMLSFGKNISTEKEKAIKSFIEYMLSKEAQELIMNGEYSPERDRYYPFRLSVREDIISSEAFLPYKEFRVFIDSYENASIDVPTPRWMIIKDSLYAPNLHLVMKNEMDINDFLDLIEEKGNVILRGE